MIELRSMSVFSLKLADNDFSTYVCTWIVAYPMPLSVIIPHLNVSKMTVVSFTATAANDGGMNRALCFKRRSRCNRHQEKSVQTNWDRRSKTTDTVEDHAHFSTPDLSQRKAMDGRVSR